MFLSSDAQRWRLSPSPALQAQRPVVPAVAWKHMLWLLQLEHGMSVPESSRPALSDRQLASASSQSSFAVQKVSLRWGMPQVQSLVMRSQAKARMPGSGASERLCQFSPEARLHRSKKNEGSCTPSLGCYTQPHWPSHSLKWMRVCAGERQSLPLPQRVPAICSPSCFMLA